MAFQGYSVETIHSSMVQLSKLRKEELKANMDWFELDDLLLTVASDEDDSRSSVPLVDLVAGMQEEIDFLTQNVLIPLFHPEVCEDLGVGIPNGILLYGLPGCGERAFCPST